MLYMKSRVDWLLRIILSFSIFVLLLIITKNVLPFSSQNGFYHSTFAKYLFSGEFPFSTFLENSIFKNGFIDQHVGYHFLVWLMQAAYPPEIAIKILTSLVLALTAFTLSLKKKTQDIFLSQLIFFFFICVFFPHFQRIFWDRPQFVNLFLIVLLFNMDTFKINRWGALILACAFSLVSFESAGLVGLAAAITFFGGKDGRKQAVFLFAGTVLSFFIFPFGIEKIKYFIGIATNNLFIETQIREWMSTKNWSAGVLTLVAILFGTAFAPQRFFSSKARIFQICSFLFLLMTFKYVRFEYIFIFFTFMMILEISLAHFDDKTKKAVFLALIPCIIWGYTEAKTKFDGDRATLQDTSAFSRWHESSRYKDQKYINFKWEYWSSLLYYNPKTNSEPGFSMYIYNAQPRIQFLYEKFRYKPDSLSNQEFTEFFKVFKANHLLIESRESFNKLIADRKWPLVPIYQDKTFIFYEFLDPRNTFNKYDSLKETAKNCLEQNNCDSSFVKRKVNSKNIDILIPIPEEDIKFIRIPLAHGHYAAISDTSKTIFSSFGFFSTPDKKDSVRYYYEYPYYSSNGQWVLMEKNLIPVDDNKFLSQLYGLFESEIKKNKSLFYIVGENKPITKRERLRVVYGLWSLCLYPGTRSLCLEQLNTLNVDDIAEWDVGSKSIYGLIEPLLSTAEVTIMNKKKGDVFSRLPELVANHYNPELRFWYDNPIRRKEILIDRKYIFGVGEALTYLSSKNLDSKYKWLQQEIDQYIAHFESEKNIYSVRWGLSILYYQFQLKPNQRKKTLDTVHRALKIIDEEFRYPYEEPKFFTGCYINQTRTQSSFNFDHHSGLILEGLSYFSSVSEIAQTNHFQKLVQGFRKCTLKQQIQAENMSKMNSGKNEVGGIRINPGLRNIRVDVLAHLAAGIYLSSPTKVHSASAL